MKKIFITLSIILSVLISTSAYSQNLQINDFKPIADSIQKMFTGRAFVVGKISIVSVNTDKKSISIYFSPQLSEYSLSENDVNKIYDIIKSLIDNNFNSKKVIAYSSGVKIEDLVLPFNKTVVDKKKTGKKRAKKIEPFVYKMNISSLNQPESGLQNRNIALWQSHGLYYEQKLLRWEWQRARIFQTVEDLYTQSYVLPFLVPMLENAGANVFLPRERDVQINEIIVDNDNPESGFKSTDGDNQWATAMGLGFAFTKNILFTGENPFESGTAVIASTTKKENLSYAHWYPQVKETGEYAVYISYKSFPNSTQSAQYEVSHSGGKTKFTVNQRVGGGTWMYLGTFKFTKENSFNQYVSLNNFSSVKNEVVTADAVKFGGGMGNIARQPSEDGVEQNRKSSSNEPIQKIKIPFETEPITSGFPRFAEGARYWLQWAGFSDTIYSPNKNANDYNDDYMSRGRWVNVLSGGSAVNPKEQGYGIPLDLSMAFHTDAGTTLNDSIIGTLGIYTRNSNGEYNFPTGEPRINSRYLTETIQSQIVDDIRRQYEPIWQKRGIWDRTYSESRSPKVPAMLLELLSHQNLADMRYGLDPNFRFTVSRAIYKGMLKYLSKMNKLEYVVQPLPIRTFCAEIKENKAFLRWTPTIDSLEPTAVSEKYIVYTRVDSAGFDNGTLVSDNKYDVRIEYGKQYSFKVTAVNRGGESFPSEILSVYNSATDKATVLIVNGFTKVSAPATFTTKDTSLAGFRNTVDEGVPYIKDISFIGYQYDFRRKVPWSDDDAPGFGSSYNNYSAKVIMGNTFDFPYIHGTALANAGYSYVSCSREAFETGNVNPSEYKIVDLIMGKQLKTVIGRGAIPVKYEVFTKEMQIIISEYLKSGGNLIISGANIGTDIWDSFTKDKNGEDFTTKILKFQLRTNNATNTGEIKSAQSPYNFNGRFSFFREPNSIKYHVEAPDGIEPIGENAWTIFRYADNNVSAGVAYKGADYKCVSLGFPIESLKEQTQINNIMTMILGFIEK